MWEAALEARWSGAPVWLDGDVDTSNLLVDNGRLSAVIDFGSLGVGDPACDVTIAWTFFFGECRESFRARLPLDDATWSRGRGWALWKALISPVHAGTANTDEASPKGGAYDRARVRRVIEEVLAEHERVA